VNWEDAQGGKIPLFNANPTNDIDNPFFNVNKNKNYDETDRVTATMGINIRPTNWLTLMGRFGYDTYNTYGYKLIHPNSSSQVSLASLLRSEWKFSPRSRVVGRLGEEGCGIRRGGPSGGRGWRGPRRSQGHG